MRTRTHGLAFLLLSSGCSVVLDTDALGTGCPEGQVPSAGACVAVDGGASCEALFAGEERVIAESATAPSIAAYQDDSGAAGFGVAYTRGSDVFFRPLDAWGNVIPGAAGQEKPMPPDEDDTSAARTSLAFSKSLRSFGLSIARERRGSFLRLDTRGLVQGEELTTTPRIGFEVGHTRVLGVGKEWLVFHTGIQSDFVFLRVRESGLVTRAEPLAGGGRVDPPSVSSFDTRAHVAWVETAVTRTSLRVTRLDTGQEEWTEPQEIAHGLPPVQVGAPVISSSASGYAVAWFAQRDDVADGVSTLRAFDAQGALRCELRLDDSLAGGLFTPRDMIDRKNGYVVLGSVDTQGGALSLLSVQVEGTNCYVRDRFPVSDEGAQDARIAHEAGADYVAVAWEAQRGDGKSEVRVRTYSVVSCP